MLGVIGGTGFAEFLGLSNTSSERLSTPYGPSILTSGEVSGHSLVFLPRHGQPPDTPPHRINYRANLRALADQGVNRIIAVNAVGSVDETLDVPELVIPDQLIDYTWGRAHTFFDDEIHHIDFTFPYDDRLRKQLIESAAGYPCRETGIYGCTQGPRLETAAEIERLRRDGCHIVGMTGMPEASLAAELGLPYAAICLVVNAGAGINNQAVAMEAIESVIAEGMGWVTKVLTGVIAATD